MKFIIWFFFFILFSAAAGAVDNYKYFAESQSFKGPTGNIQTISTKTVPYKTWSFGLHRFSMGVNYGLLRGFETGVSFNVLELTPLFPLDNDSMKRKSEEFSLASKYRLLREEEHPVDISLGHRRDTFYIAAGKYSETLWDMTLEAGVSWQEDDGLFTFFSIKQTKSLEQFIFDYDPKTCAYNLGYRFLVSPEMKLDFFLTDFTRIKNIFFDNFYFGLTVTG